MKKPTLLNKLTLFFNRLFYGQPKLCAKHSIESKARSIKLSLFECELCSPEELEKSKMEQAWFNELTPELINLAESDWESLITTLNQPIKDNPALQEAYQRYKDKYGDDV